MDETRPDDSDETSGIDEWHQAIGAGLAGDLDQRRAAIAQLQEHDRLYGQSDREGLQSYGTTNDGRDALWWTEPIDDRWTAAYRYVLQDGALVVAEVRVFPDDTPVLRLRARAQMLGLPFEGFWSGDVLGSEEAAASVPRGGLTARKLRQLHLRGANAMTDRYAVTIRKSYGDDGELFEADLLAALDEIGEEPRRPGRAGRPDSFYAQVASTYVRAQEAGSSRPTKDAAEALGLKQSYVRDVLHDARERGLLTKTLPGRAGGRLTAKARRLLVKEETKRKEAQ